MSVTKLSLRIEGEPGTIRLRSFVEMMGQALAVLSDLDSRISRQPRGSVEWYVEGLRTSSLAADVVSRAKKPRLPDVSGHVAEVFVSGLGAIEDRGAIPEYFDLETLLHVQRIAKPLGRNGASAFGASIGPDNSARIDAQAHEHLASMVTPRYRAIGSVIGRLEMISVHGRTPRFSVWEMSNQRAVRCIFSADNAEILETAKAMLGRRVIVQGRLQRNVNGEPLRLEVERILPIPGENELPTTEEFIGAFPDLTEGLTSAEYIARLHQN